MPKVSLENLVKRRQVWFAQVHIPADVREVLGQTVFRQTTQERDPHRAAVRAAPIIATWKHRIAEARGEATDAQRARILDMPSLARLSPAAKRIVLEEARLPVCLFAEHLETWRAALAAQGMKPRQVDQYASDVALYAPEGEKLELEAATLARTQGWVEGRIKAGDGLKTIQRRLAALRNYWGHLQDLGRVPNDAGLGPFDGKRLRMPKAPKKKASAASNREAFSVEDVVRLHTQADRQALKDLITLAAYTGGRIEELCTLQAQDVSLDKLIMRLDSKTDAGRRDVPVVAALEPLVRRLIQDSKDGYLVPTSSNNQYGERSHNLGQRFGRLKTALGFGPGHVFHSIRKTVATLLHSSGCPEAIAADILGHELQTMSYGVYSSGSSMEARREWLGKALAYPGLLG